jgi:hypothetical protein
MRRITLLDVGLILLALLLIFFGAQWLFFPDGGQDMAIPAGGKYAPSGSYVVHFGGALAQVCGVLAILLGCGLGAIAVHHMRQKR